METNSIKYEDIVWESGIYGTMISKHSVKGYVLHHNLYDDVYCVSKVGATTNVVNRVTKADLVDYLNALKVGVVNNLLHDYIMDKKFVERPCSDTDWLDYMTQSNKALLKSGSWQLCEKYEEYSHYEMRNLMKQELENMIALYEDIKKAS